MERLVDIVTQPPSLMPSSIKITCLHFINVFLDYPYGMEWFLGWTDEQVLSDSYLTEGGSHSSYRRLLELILTNQVSQENLREINFKAPSLSFSVSLSLSLSLFASDCKGPVCL